jgi:hypothetical protein
VSGDRPPAGLAALLARPGTGTFTVRIGPRRRDRLMARAAGHRRAGLVPVGLDVRPLPGARGVERWARSVAGRPVVSTVRWRDGALVERVGPLDLTFRAATTRTGARLDLRHAALAAGPVRIRLPRPLVPVIACTTKPGPLGLAVRVDVRSRRGRRILAYEGTLA